MSPSGPRAPDGSAALLRLMQLVSPALPVGAYAYSHGLEWAIQAGWVQDAAQTEAWIQGLLHNVWARLDVPVLGRLMECLAAANGASGTDGGAADETLDRWCDFLHSSRETAELQDEDRRMGQALARLLEDLDVPGVGRWAHAHSCSFPVPWAYAAVHWNIAPATAAAGMLWTYAEHQVAAAIKLVPLGQTAGQRMLGFLGSRIPAAVAAGLALDESEIGQAAPALAIASALHETQYTRLFRS